MALTPGTRLGPHEIQAALGAGGIGEVYTATDPRLDRTVAVKVLPEHVATATDLKQRLEREANPIPSLTHGWVIVAQDDDEEHDLDDAEEDDEEDEDDYGPEESPGWSD